MREPKWALLYSALWIRALRSCTFIMFEFITLDSGFPPVISVSPLVTLCRFWHAGRSRETIEWSESSNGVNFLKLNMQISIEQNQISKNLKLNNSFRTQNYAEPRSHYINHPKYRQLQLSQQAEENQGFICCFLIYLKHNQKTKYYKWQDSTVTVGKLITVRCFLLSFQYCVKKKKV